MATRQQLVSDMRANESSASCDKHLHIFSFRYSGAGRAGYCGSAQKNLLRLSVWPISATTIDYQLQSDATIRESLYLQNVLTCKSLRGQRSSCRIGSIQSSAQRT